MACRGTAYHENAVTGSVVTAVAMVMLDCELYGSIFMTVLYAHSPLLYDANFVSTQVTPRLSGPLSVFLLHPVYADRPGILRTSHHVVCVARRDTSAL
jgi:hypothetical protein